MRTSARRGLRLVGGVVYPVLFFGLALFLPAGTVHWARAWILLGVVFAAASLTMFGIFPRRPELLEERYKPAFQKGQPLSDKILTPLLVSTFLGCIVFIPIARFHLQLGAETGLPVAGVGLALFGFGWALIALGMKENAYAAPVVKAQSERGQRVIDTGLYAHVRHPMYSGMAPLIVGMALWLGSWAAALLVVLPVGILVLRIRVEEQLLTRSLPGYASYCRKVRWRLIPGLW